MLKDIITYLRCILLERCVRTLWCVLSYFGVYLKVATKLILHWGNFFFNSSMNYKHDDAVPGFCCNAAQNLLVRLTAFRGEETSPSDCCAAGVTQQQYFKKPTEPWYNRPQDHNMSLTHKCFYLLSRKSNSIFRNFYWIIAELEQQHLFFSVSHIIFWMCLSCKSGIPVTSSHVTLWLQ